MHTHRNHTTSRNKIRSPHSRGFTILLAALVASLVLALGISVFTIAQKQLVLSSMGRHSQYAFYAADTAAECALYFDMRQASFNPALPAASINCNGATPINISNSGLGSYPVIFTFEFEPNGYCAQVSVTKNTTHPRTVIHADGFSTPCSEIQTSRRVLQRSVELTY